jgi:ssDNA-binding replication factor A large subunit
MKTEMYISKIIEETGLTKIEIQNMVEEKKKELKGLISDEGALFIIAKELGVDVKDQNKEILKEIEINISDITPNMKNITILGRIKEIYRVHEFNRSDGNKGFVGSFLLHDNSGDIRITLWDDQIKIFKDNNFNMNELVKILNGYAKKGRNGEPEIHVGRMGKVILSPDDADYKNYPKIKSELVTINNINLNMKSISIEGSIIQILPVREFTKKDGELGKVRSLHLLDSSGESIRVTFWNENTENTLDLKTGEYILLNNLNPRMSSLDSKTIEVHANNYTTIVKKEKKIKFEGIIVDKIEHLQNKKGVVSFQGIISSVDNLKRITSKTGEEISLLGFVVSDNSDGIRITLWSEKAEEFAETLKVGTGIALKNVMVKYSNFSGRNEISLLNDSEIDFIDLDIANIKEIAPRIEERTSKFLGNYTKISEIKSPGNYEIKGFIAKELNSITIYEACSKCNKKIDNCTCEEKGNPENRMIFNIIIDDGSGTIRATVIGDRAEELVGEKTDNILKIKETPDFEGFLQKRSKDLLGKDIVIKGRVKFSDYSNSYEISAYEFQDVNTNEELEKLIKEIET